jgi:two-component system, chemotaxis family, CheB/CheR fusion protein
MSAPATADPAFEALLQFLKRSRGFDFTGYKRASLERRFRRRMEAVGCNTFADYLDFLEVHPDEFAELFNTLLINVTEFFRDPPAWEYLRDQALPPVLADKPSDEPIRVWSAGCATGQEPCTIAMILAEMLGHEAYCERAKIYATDIDEDALAIARQATYGAKEIETLPAELRDRYFERADQRYAFRKDMRRTLIFGRNNLVEDAPISRLDLLVCRNTLMYFTAETQARILRRFNFALRPTGILMLGKSEMMVSHREQFAAMDIKQRVFRRLGGGLSLQARVTGMNNGEGIDLPPTEEDVAARDAALEVGPTAQLVVSREGQLVFANLAARALFSIGAESLGQPLGEQPVAVDPVALTNAVEQATREGRTAAVGEVEVRPSGGEQRRLDVTVVPLLSRNSAPLGALVVFDDVTRLASLRADLETNRKDLQAAYEELESTIDELETTNEELQSANEELQTTNEELQSTNEELETMNEELQSSNEELETINDELRDRTGELNQVNEFLEAILTSLGFAVAVLDKAQRVIVWNRGAEELWGLRSNEVVDQYFLSLDFGLRPERLAAGLRSVMSGGSAEERATLDAVNRRGRAILCEATVMPLTSRATDGAVQGAIVLMEERAAADAGDGTGRGG